MRRKLLELSLTYAVHHRVTVYVTWAILTVVSLVCLGWFGLGVDTSRQGMVGENDPDSRRFRAFGREFGATLNNVVIVEGPNPEQNRRFADTLANQLRAKADQVGAVIYRTDPAQFREFALLYADGPQLESLDDLLASVVQLEWDSTESVTVQGITDVVGRLNQGLAKLEDGETDGLGPLGDMKLDVNEASEGIVSAFKTLRAAVANPEWNELALIPETQRGDLLAAGVDDFGYLSSHDGKMLFLFVQPASESDQSQAMQIFTDTILREIEAVPHPEQTVLVTGYPATIAAEMGLMITDVIGTSVASVVLVLLIFAIAYRSLTVTAIAFVPLVVGIVVTLGVAAVTVGRINMLSSAFFAFLVGLGIDFSIHVVARFREARANGLNPGDAVQETMMGTGIGVFTGGMTTIAAFLAAAYSDFTGMVELGLLSAAGLGFVLAAALTLLPCILVGQAVRQNSPVVATPDSTAQSATQRGDARPAKAIHRGVVVAAVFMTVGLGLCIRPLQFNFDVAELLPGDEPALLALQKLRKENVFSPDFAAVVTSSITEAQTLGAALAERSDLVARVESVATYLPQIDAKKTQTLTALSEKLNRLPKMSLVVENSGQGPTLVTELEKLAAYAELDLPLTLRIHKQEHLLPIAAALAKESKHTADVLRQITPELLSERLKRFDAVLGGLINDAVTTLRAGKKHMDVADLPDELLRTYWRPAPDGSGRFAVRVFPRGSIADPEFMAEFREFVLPLAPEITGLPITYLAWGNLLRDGLERSAILALIAIILLVFADFRTVRYTTLALLPLVLGTIWMVGLMNLLNIGYNFANIVAIPLILGIGVDSGVHMVHRLREGVPPNRLVATAGKAITISSLTTLAAFGALAAAQHRGLQSLGLTLVIGVVACLISAVIVLPAWLGWRKQ